MASHMSVFLAQDFNWDETAQRHSTWSESKIPSAKNGGPLTSEMTTYTPNFFPSSTSGLAKFSFVSFSKSPLGLSGRRRSSYHIGLSPLSLTDMVSFLSSLFVCELFRRLHIDLSPHPPFHPPVSMTYIAQWNLSLCRPVILVSPCRVLTMLCSCLSFDHRCWPVFCPEASAVPTRWPMNGNVVLIKAPVHLVVSFQRWRWMMDEIFRPMEIVPSCL